MVAPQRELETSIQPLKKPTASHLPEILKSNTETRFNIFFTFSPSSPAYGTIYRVTGGFLTAETSILKRISVRIFKISKCFHRSKQKLKFPFSLQQGIKKFKKPSVHIPVYIKFQVSRAFGIPQKNICISLVLVAHF